jgi:hypothetical protein
MRYIKYLHSQWIMTIIRIALRTGDPAICKLLIFLKDFYELKLQ